ncbi:hypothetical protein AKKGGB_AKKGGB_06895, partial [Dysosmobacter welbionis]
AGSPDRSPAPPGPAGSGCKAGCRWPPPGSGLRKGRTSGSFPGASAPGWSGSGGCPPG